MSEKELEEKVAALAKQVAALQAKLEPTKPTGVSVVSDYRRYDPTENFTMPQDAVAKMVAAIPEREMLAISGDARRARQDMVKDSGQAPRGPGWRNASAIDSPPGIGNRLIDLQVEASGKSEEQKAEAWEKAKRLLAEEDADAVVTTEPGPVPHEVVSTQRRRA